MRRSHPPPAGRGMNLPIWLMTILFALAFAGVVLGVVWLMSSNKGSAGTGPAPTAAVESPAAKPGAKTNAMQKYIEVTGVRFVLDAKKKTQVKFVVINHSEADINGLAGQRDDLGPHEEIGRRRAGHVLIQHESRAVRIEGD